MTAIVRNLVIIVTIAMGQFLTSAMAQHEDHQHGQAATPADKSDTGKPGAMMSGGMMSMPQMMKEQEETVKLVEQLTKSFAAIEAEKDPKILKEKLAEHGALLKELEAKVQGHAQKMEMMHHMMGGSKMGEDTKK